MTLTNLPMTWMPLAEAILKATLVLATGALASIALRRASAALRHMVWTLALCGALAVPVLTFVLPKVQVPVVTIEGVAESEDPVPPFAERTAPLAKSAGAQDRALQSERPAAAEAALQPELPVPQPLADRRTADSGSGETIAMTWQTALVAIWIVGLALVLARILLGTIAISWLSRRTQEITDAPWLPMARALAGEMGVTPRLRFLRTGRASMPVAAGIFRPSVMMPADADAWPDSRLRIVLLHELAHVKRRDCLTHLVAQAACALYWFNPLAWMAARRARTERERACDDLVIASGTRNADYADQLLEIARVMRGSRFAGLLTGASLAMAHHSQLEGRLIAILDPRVPRGGVSRARRAGVIASCCAVLAMLGAVQPWAAEITSAEIKSLDIPDVRGDVAAAQAVASESQTQPVAPEPADTATPAVPGTSGPVPVPAISGVIPAVPAPSSAASTPFATPATPQAGVTPSPAMAPTPVASPAAAPEPMIAAIEASAAAFAVGAAQLDDQVRALAAATEQVEQLRLRMTENHPDVRRAQQRVAELRQQIAQAQQAAQAAQPAQNAKPVVAGGKVKPGKGSDNPPDPRTVAALTAALKDTDKEVRETAMQALIRMRDPSIYEPLVQALKDASPDVREQAVFGLGQLRDKRAIQPLISALKDESADVRGQAAFALGQLRDGAAVEALVVAIKDSVADVREQIAFALGQIRDPRGIDALATLLKDASADVRQQAAFALGQVAR